MKRVLVTALVAASLVIGIQASSFASDWDKAGKALAIIEGIRVVTGGKVDVIGTVTGINRPRQEARERGYARDDDRGRSYGRGRGRSGHERYERCVRVWVPHYVWKERFVPQHTEHRPGCGEVIIEAHYERYQVQEGGHWEYIDDRGHSSRCS